MRRLLLSCLPVLLTGCALLPPRHDPNQAWIELHSSADEQLQALQVDEKPLDDDRFFQVSPGQHELQVRFQFEVDPSNIGPQSEARARTCLLTIAYADFAAGGTYRLEADSRGFRPRVQLYDARGQQLARAREGRCGEV
ncbi:hypothetical protein A9179_22040 [Pseudomonas alcaligenes]|uniref:Lipoprotein n=1 Tax=Aquipseudomonas alcaligenes TaxID=43263 RepID=A0ABR7S5V2_AQUAC|nr:hypothetical protein [Pseudomonas alcaligenes]MBC9252951.1 hypothetical protein [Pseudomonas alcaligenes]